MSNLQGFYTKFLHLLHQITAQNNFRHQIRQPKLSDKELIALSLAAEAVSIDSELHLFKQLPPQVNGKIERSVYNKRRRQLSDTMESLRQQIVEQMSSHETHFLIDSMPLEVCQYSRAKRSRTCAQWLETAPDYGYCASQRFHFYGYKIHAVCTPQGVFKTFDISKASVHDIQYLNDIKHQLQHCVLVGDKGYLSQQYQQDLFQQAAIQLGTPQRKNQLTQKPFPRLLRKARKRIETLFSQLCDQFMIRRNYAKTFHGFASRILAKMTALTLIQWHNKMTGNKLNNIKIAFS